MTKAVKKPVQKSQAPKPKISPAKAAKGTPKKKVTAKGPAASAKAEKPKTAAKKQVATSAKKIVPESKAITKKTRTVKKTTKPKTVDSKTKKSVKKTIKRSSRSTAVKATKAASVKATRKQATPKKAATKKTAPKKPTAKSSALIKKTIGKKASVKSVKSPIKMRSGKPIAKPEADELIKEFRKVVNLTPEELERRLSTPIAKKLGLRDAAQAGIVGHESGRRILAILTKSRRAYTDDDLRHMKIVVKYVRKRRSEKPPGDIFASNWRFSLLNWGHDPMRSRRR